MIIDDDCFDADENFVLIRNSKDEEEFSTPYTMLDLDFDIKDVVNSIRQLTAANYSETLVDRDDSNPPLLFVFGKVINKRTIYIKLKTKKKSNYILCVSFHYAKHQMNYPYA